MHVTIMHILSLVEEEITERIQSDSLHCRRPRNRKPMNQANQNWVKKQSSVAVSYTHLTLPTKLSV